MEAPDDNTKLLNKFRENLIDILTPDHTDSLLMKFLRARNYNLKKAEEIFREVDSNKRIFGVYELLGNYVKPEVAEKYERTVFLGFAKDGTPIRYAAYAIDYKGFLNAMSGYDLCIYFSHLMEMDYSTLREESKRIGRELNGMTYIFDTDGFSLQDCLYKCAIETAMDFMGLVQDHYPEVWERVLVVNAPAYFYKVFNFLKPIFRPTLLEKIQVVSKQETGELLRKYIDEDVLPAFLGGKRVDSKGDPKCGELFPALTHTNCKLPKEYYYCNKFPLLSREDPEVLCAVAGARSVLNLHLRCPRAGTKYRLQYRTEGGSIAMKIFYREDLDGELPASNEPIIPYEGEPRYRQVSACVRVQSHMAQIDGTGTMTWAGTYILQLDNTSSWFTSRTVFYRLTEIPPES